MRRFLGRLGLRLAALSVAATVGSGAVIADQWANYRLGEATFEAPADWKVARRQRDRSFLLQDPQGKLELRVEWWLQDEPLLGYDHIKSHKRIILAGKRATYIHSVFPDRQVLMAALDETRRDGRKLLLALEGTGIGLAAMTALFEDVLGRVTFGKAATESPKSQPTAQPQPPAPSKPDAPPPAEPGGVLRDAQGGFTIRAPAGWRRGTTERDGMRILTLAPADRQAVILVAVLTATPERDVPGLVEDFQNLYYDDYFLADSIEGEGDLRIGTLEGRYVEMFGDVHTIEGVRPAFSQGRSWLFKSIGSDRAYIIAFIHARSASAALKASLDATVRTLRTSETAAAQPARPSEPAAPPQAALSPQMRVVASYFANDCEAVSLATWTHPALAMIRRRKQASLEWAMLCRNRSHPVFGVDFHYDPQGRTSDFFNPLYDDVLQASRGASFSFVALAHKVIVDVSQPRRDEISTDFREIPDLPQSRAPETGGLVTTQRPPEPAAAASTSAARYLPAPYEGPMRLWVGPVSFEAPAEWRIKPDVSVRSITLVRPDPGAEIVVSLWEAERPMPNAGIERLEHVFVADAPATRLRLRTGALRTEHIFFDEPLADGSRISVAYRARGEAVEDGAPLLALLLASLDRNQTPPGGPTPWMVRTAQSGGDPFANLDMSEFETQR